MRLKHLGDGSSGYPFAPTPTKDGEREFDIQLTDDQKAVLIGSGLYEEVSAVEPTQPQVEAEVVAEIDANEKGDNATEQATQPTVVIPEGFNPES